VLEDRAQFLGNDLLQRVDPDLRFEGSPYSWMILRFDAGLRIFSSTAVSIMTRVCGCLCHGKRARIVKAS
jgi:hypothetical protein